MLFMCWQIFSALSTRVGRSPLCTYVHTHMLIYRRQIISSEMHAYTYILAYIQTYITRLYQKCLNIILAEEADQRRGSG